MPKRTRNSHQPPQGGRCTPAPVRAEILPIGISLGAPKCDLAILASLVCTEVPPQTQNRRPRFRSVLGKLNPVFTPDRVLSA